MNRSAAPRSMASYVFACIAAAASLQATAQSYPVKPVRILVGNGPGTSPDVQMRLVAEKLPGEWKQQVIIENVAGASSNIAAERVAAATPDGYTLFYASIGPLTINMHLFSKLNYMEVTARPPKEFAAWQKSESDKMGALVKASGAKLD